MVQELSDSLIETYNLRAITIDNETWYGINDLPLSSARKNISRLRNNGNKDFVDNNTKLINISILNSNNVKNKNFDKINNRGELFGNDIMLMYLVQNSHMSLDDKEKYLSLFNKTIISTRKEIEFLDELENALSIFNIKGIKQYSVLLYRIDYYIPDLNIAIEYDENNHDHYSYESHEGRQLKIEKELGCRFIRISDNNNIGYNIGYVIKNIFNL